MTGVERWPLWGGRGVFGSTTCFFCVTFMLTVSHNHDNLIYCVEIKYMKSLNNVLNQNVNVTKRVRFVTFAISIVHKFSYCSSLNKNKKIKIRLPRLIINVQYGSIRDHS